MTKKILTTLSSIMIAALVTGCQLDVPIKEMVTARSSITRAYEVKADTYAPEELKKAEDMLYECQAQLKKDDTDKAKNTAKDARASADAAIEKSLPLLAADTLAQAKKAYEDADKLYAEKFATEDYTRSGELIKEAETLTTEQKYWDSYLKSKEAIALAGSAISASEAQVALLQEKLGNLNASLDDIKNRELNKTDQESIKEIESFLSVAQTDLDNRDLKRATAHIDEASAKIDVLKAGLAEGEIRAKIADLRDETEGLKNERGLDFAAKEIEDTTVLLNEAETSLGEKNIDESREKITSAETLLKAAKDKMDRGIAEEKLASVTRLKDDIEAKDTKKKFAGEIANSGALLAQSREMFDNNAYNESLQKSIEAETLLNSVTVSLEKEYGIVSQPEGDTGTTDLQGGEVQIYVVQYYKKDKDCLWRIAQKVYKDARQWPRIYMANKDQIKDPDLIFPGQKFIIPPLNTPVKKKDSQVSPVEEKDKGDMAEKPDEEKPADTR